MKFANKLTLTTALLSASALAFTACGGSNTSANEGAQTNKAAEKVVMTAIDSPSGTYVIDKTHGYVTFSYNHMGLSNPQIRFRDVDASIEFDGQHPENSKVSATINAASIDSGVDIFDDHLNSDGWFDTAKHPSITFESTGFTRASQTEGTMTGTMTVMGVSKALSFDVTLIGAKPHFRTKAPVLGLEGRTSLKRSDFGLGKYAPGVSDEVDVVISAEFSKTE